MKILTRDERPGDLLAYISNETGCVHYYYLVMSDPVDDTQDWNKLFPNTCGVVFDLIPRWYVWALILRQDGEESSFQTVPAKTHLIGANEYTMLISEVDEAP